MKPITPCLWFDFNGEEAAEFYTSLFPNSSTGKIVRYAEGSPGPEGAAMTVPFTLNGKPFLALNGGPQFKFNPSMSFFALCPTVEDVDRTFAALSEGGAVFMPLGEYAWSKRYGWCQDRFGLSWQIMLGDGGITPSLLFAGAKQGKAEEAVKFYTSLIRDSKVNVIVPYEAGSDGPEGQVSFAEFVLQGSTFIAMDSGVEMTAEFNESVSFMLYCDTQEEIDTYWDAMTSNGGEESQCGWCKDRFGLSWQILPTALDQMMSDPDRVGHVMQAIMPMKKLDLAVLQAVYEAK